MQGFVATPLVVTDIFYLKIYLRPDIERTPRPVAFTPSRPGLLMETVNPSGDEAHGHIASGRSPLAWNKWNYFYT